MTPFAAARSELRSDRKGRRGGKGRLSVMRRGRLSGRKDQAYQGDANQKPENEGGGVADWHRMVMPRSLVTEHVERLQSAGKRPEN
jgi:hypothetical protein